MLQRVPCEISARLCCLFSVLLPAGVAEKAVLPPYLVVLGMMHICSDHFLVTKLRLQRIRVS